MPPAVWIEVVEEAARSGWLRVVTPTNEALVRSLNRDLDAGEAEAIALAVEYQQLLLVDETDARRMADIHKLPKTGVIGILMRAKREGKLTSLRDELDRLRQETGFWIREDIYQQALKAMGESP